MSHQASTLSSMSRTKSTWIDKNNSNNNERSRTDGVVYWKELRQYPNAEQLLLDECQAHLQSNEFSHVMRGLGLEGFRYREAPNAHLHAAFLQTLSSLLLEQSSSSTTTAATTATASTTVVGIVFHGTATENIQSILEQGLDVNKRKTQQYGPGEYFAKEPTLSLSFCKGGHELLAFAVVLPESLIDPRGRPIPPDFVVVPDNRHHLPLGCISFDKANRIISGNQKKEFRQLGRQAAQAQELARESEHKAKIIQHIIQERVDIASELYLKWRLSLSETCQREIAMYVHHVLDADVLPVYFPDLPAPWTAQEHEQLKLLRVQDAYQEADRVRQKLETQANDLDVESK